MVDIASKMGIGVSRVYLAGRFWEDWFGLVYTMHRQEPRYLKKVACFGYILVSGLGLGLEYSGDDALMRENGLYLLM